MDWLVRTERFRIPTVNRWLLRAPLWALAAVCGIPLAVFLEVLLHFGRHQAWLVALVPSVVCGVVGGLMTAATTRRRSNASLAAVGDVPEDVRTKVASRRTLGGPVPADPVERAATADLIDHQIAELRRRRVGTFTLTPAVMVLFAWFALTRSPWWWLGVAVLAVLFVLILRTPAMLERRAERLREATADG